MAIVQNPIVGRSSGKFGNAIFSKNYTKNVLRSKPIEVVDAGSDAQLAQRHNMSVVVAFVSDLLAFIRAGFRGYTTNMSAFALAIAANLPAGLKSVGINSKIDPSYAELSRGNLTPLIEVIINAADATAIDVGFSSVITGNAAATDQISLAVLDADGIVKASQFNITTRDNGSAALAAGDVAFAETDTIFLMVTSATTKVKSEMACPIQRIPLAFV
jgi:hypothetical protein